MQPTKRKAETSNKKDKKSALTRPPVHKQLNNRPVPSTHHPRLPSTTPPRPPPVPLEADRIKHIIPHLEVHWKDYTPADIVAMIRKSYPKVSTSSTHVSDTKKALSVLPNPPPAAYLSQLRLQPQEYQILKQRDAAKKEADGADARVIHSGDDIIRQALILLQSSDPRLLWPAVIVCSGLRPIEILTTLIRPAPQYKRGNHDDFWVCIKGYAKKGNVKDVAERDMCRDRPLLCPSWLFIRAIGILRERFTMVGLTNKKMHAKWGTYQIGLLEAAFPNVMKPTHVLFRRLYAKAAWAYYFDEMGDMTENYFTSWVLGHSNMSLIVPYSSLIVLEVGALDLFRMGRDIPKPAARKLR